MSRKTRRNSAKNAAKRLRHRAILRDYPTAGITGLSGLALALSGPLYAADDVPAPAGSSSNNEPLQEVVVTGIRASLQKSLDIKEQSVGVVDAISAEDIGQFPDANLAEAVQRIPGISISRGASSMGGTPTSTGEGTEITVRGFGPTFNETLYDGRQAATATKDRGFDFSSVGADFVKEVDVLKTPDTTLSSGAIGATINIKYANPFDVPGLRAAASGSADYASDDGHVTPKVGLLFSDTFADDTFGILVDAAYSKRKTTANHVNIQGWEGTTLNSCQYVGGPACTTNAQGNFTTPADSRPAWFIQDYGIYHEMTEESRKDGRLAFQWRPTDALLITLDDNFSEDVQKATEYAYSVWFNSGSLTDVVRANDGTLTSFSQANTPTDFQGQIIGSVIQNNMVGLNVAWDINSTFKAELDADQSKSKLNPGGQFSSIDSDVGYGPSAAGGTNGANVGIAGVGIGALPYPTSVGPNGNSAAFINNGIIGSHVFPIQSQQNVDRINQFKVQGTWKGDEAQLRFGFQYTDDKKDLAEYDTFTNNDWQAYAGYGPASNNPNGIALPQSFFTGSFSTANFIRGFNNSNALPPNVLAFNPYQVLAYLNGLNGQGAVANCCTPPFSGTYELALAPGMVQSIDEKTYAPFVNLSETTHLGSMTLKSSFGVRYESTYLTTGGLQQLPTGLTVQAADHTAFLVSYAPFSSVSNEFNYRYVLPNLDLNLALTDNLKARLDASRTLTRPPLNDITPALVVPQGIRTNALVATGGNPGLQPFLSDNLDVGLEWYYGRNDYISVDAFLKEVTNFIVGGTTQQPINNVIDPTTGKLGVFSVTTEFNGPSAEVRGVEIGAQHMLWDTGFGLQANATFVSTNKPYNPNDVSTSEFAITGLANSANVVAFFERWGFHIRVAVNWRDGYLDHFGQLQNNSQFGTEPTFVNSNTQVDLSSSYDIDRNFSVFFEGLNLNNSTYSTHGRFKEEVLDVVDFGPRFTLGVRAKF
jgi:iron complex outermembrane receptor protein